MVARSNDSRTQRHLRCRNRRASARPPRESGGPPTDRHPLRGIAQAFTRRDDERAAETRRRMPEGLRVGEFPPEVQRAEKAEDLAEWHARSAAQLQRQRERRTVVEEERGTLAVR